MNITNTEWVLLIMWIGLIIRVEFIAHKMRRGWRISDFNFSSMAGLFKLLLGIDSKQVDDIEELFKGGKNDKDSQE